MKTHYEVRSVVVLDPLKQLQSELFVFGRVIVTIIPRASDFGRFRFLKNVFKVKLEFVPEWQFFLVVLHRRHRYLLDSAKEFVSGNVALTRVLPIDCMVRTSVEYLESNKKRLIEMLKVFALHEAFPKFGIWEEVDSG